MKKHIVCTVTNDLSYDQRMNRICTSLVNAGHAVTLVGRERQSSTQLQKKPFNQVRLRCRFETGKLFYIEYNLKLFFHLLFTKYDIICGIDLDSIVPTYFISRLKRKPFVYDAHEYFTEMEEVVSRPIIKWCWELVERIIVPKVKHGYTVSEGYANMFYLKYDTQFEIIRNATIRNGIEVLPANQREYILYQGAANVGRGLEELLEAMKMVNYQLFICGKGDIYESLKLKRNALSLSDRVDFKGFIEPEDLKEYTRKAKIGITLFSNKGLSNHHSLANRFFDYMHSGVPQIAMNYPEYVNFNKKFEVAVLIEELSPEAIAAAINKLLSDSVLYERLVQNSLKAREEYNWQCEDKKLQKFYSAIA